MLKSLADAKRFLEREPIACIATVDSEGKAHIVPVWFTYNNGKVHIQTDRKSVKVRNLRRNESVAVAIYNLGDEAVIIRGRGRIIEDEKEFLKRTQQHIDKYRIALDEHGRDNMGIPLLDRKVRCVIEVDQEKILFW